METVQRVEVPCDREHLSELRVPTAEAAALESVARLLAHQRTPRD